jgi:hypothetical protein
LSGELEGLWSFHAKAKGKTEEEEGMKKVACPLLSHFGGWVTVSSEGGSINNEDRI